MRTAGNITAGKCALFRGLACCQPVLLALLHELKQISEKLDGARAALGDVLEGLGEHTRSARAIQPFLRAGVRDKGVGGRIQRSPVSLEAERKPGLPARLNAIWTQS